MRADARENRTRILVAARAALDADGSASMNQIAQRAGVGAGTLYRNFATREALLLAVYEEEVAALLASAPALLDEAEPLEALRTWIADLVAAMRRKHGLGDALSPGAHQAIAEQTHTPVVAAIDLLLAAGKADGSIRADADAGDVLQLTAGMWRAAQGADDRAPRMLGLVIDGLRPTGRR